MDITKELEKLSINEDINETFNSIDNEYRSLVRQQTELLKKAHLLKVISLVNKIENYIEQDIFSKKNIQFIRCESYYNGQGNGEFEIDLLNKEKIDITKIYPQEYQLINREISKVAKFNVNFTDKNLISAKHTIELKPGCGEKLRDLLLSDELKKVLEYNKMQLDLAPKDEDVKRLKI